MSDIQTEMLLATRGQKPEELAARMVTTLDRWFKGAWATRKDMALYGFTDRQCRMARQHSNGKIIAGQAGYKLTAFATLEELRRAANTLHSQATAMLREETELWRVLHGRGAVAEQTEGAKQ